MNNIFVGFCTGGPATTRDFTYYDIDLINRDLSNAFNTRVGERVMRPDYGCKIWDYFMEQMTDGIKEIVVNEAIRICESDSRLSVNKVQVFSFDKGIQVAIELNYIPFGVVSTFYANFDARQNSEFGQ